MNKAVFLDRDGTINKEVDHLYKIEDFTFITGAIKAIKMFHKLGYKVIIITNQAGVAKGLYRESDILKLHHYIDTQLNLHNTYIDAYYYCPHHIDGKIKKYKKECICRKPNTGMIKKALKDFNLNLKESILIGDTESDILTGINAQIKKSILVRTGHKINLKNSKAKYIYDNIYEYAKSLSK